MRLLARLLPRYAAGTLPQFLARRVRTALETDVDLATEYDALRRAERMLRGGQGLGIAQREAMEAALFGGATPAGSAEASTAVGAPTFSSRTVSGWATALAAVAAVGFFAVRPVEVRYGVGDLDARGARIAADPVGVKVTCVSRAENQVLSSATAGARRNLDVLRCPAASLLAFSTTNLGKETRHIFVLGVADDGSRRWYAPFSQDSSAVVVEPGSVDGVLPSLADTGGMPAGKVTLFVLVSDTAFSAADLERQLRDGARSGIPLGRVDRLPVEVPLQARIDLTP